MPTKRSNIILVLPLPRRYFKPHNILHALNGCIELGQEATSRLLGAGRTTFPHGLAEVKDLPFVKMMFSQELHSMLVSMSFRMARVYFAGIRQYFVYL